MGTLYEHRNAQVKELTDSYKGIMVILRHFISKDKYTENHCYRVSQYAARIAVELGLAPSRVEDVRAAVLLHDIGKLEVSRQISARSCVVKHVLAGASRLSGGSRSNAAGMRPRRAWHWPDAA